MAALKLPEFRKFVRGCGCCVPGCRRPAQAHHVRTKGARGEYDPANLAPLCAHHHTGAEGVHYLGERTWTERFGVCLPAVAFVMWARWLARGGSMQPQDMDMAW